MATEFPYAKRVAAQIWLAVSRGLSGSQRPVKGLQFLQEERS
jgi:hypothetical protein